MFGWVLGLGIVVRGWLSVFGVVQVVGFVCFAIWRFCLHARNLVSLGKLSTCLDEGS